MRLDEVKRGQRVAFVPKEADGDLNHPQVRKGTVRSRGTKFAYVMFDQRPEKIRGDAATNVYPKNLVLLDEAMVTIEAKQITRDAG